ncbi:PEP/pyruvate-binding domain-containing protein [Algibacter sp. L4_22]|uniref:PEP/pyruvate-binding domain-containing protein n=1 Tax=Algibacter sp. L4_22 TaxID=2942477 RepID=UPI00201B5216|nr:PEP/pyruvate-binding domain-containing protein [Algibacter sp. L4_22]MCL5130304.1 phosphoenolpyruvate synthase [Algibacter sp. L4_22]
MKIREYILLFVLTVIASNIYGQTLSNEKITAQIEFYKNDIRGPYKSIQWFCDDGTMRAAKDPCPDEIGGVQHATYKNEVITLGQSNHVFLGQILAYTDKTDFWDISKNHSRLKQYQLGRYLARVDDGWINKKGQFYRGSIQIEDEEVWGVKFYKWLLSKDEVLLKNYYLVLQSLKDVPHQGDDDLSQLMRSQSKVISDQYGKFMDLRVKIHSNPEVIDIEKTLAFKKENALKLSSTLSKKIDELVATMQKFHKPVSLDELMELVDKLQGESGLKTSLKIFISENSNTNDAASLTKEAAKMLLDIRLNSVNEKGGAQRLILLDIANKLETVVFKTSADWQPKTVREQLEKVDALAMAAAGTGAIELWEWEQVAATLQPNTSKKATLGELTKKLEAARGIVEWSSAMVKANYQDVVNMYTAFEPKAYSFIDDRIRSSVALQLGKAVGDLGAFIAKESSLSNKVLNLSNQSSIRGLNPGYAFGELVVVNGNPDDIEVSSDKIYIFERAPADLKPVAGIATVAEGNLVSHVQLLARNLAIPNAALSDENLKNLMAFNGEKVFYAVSNRGTVILKEESKMTAEEKGLFAKKVRKEDKIEVPVKDIRLDQTKILNLRDVDASDSGKLCGPKAANLGQLKSMFKDNVVEGFVIPFGIFRIHMDQAMPNQGKSYWEFLNAMFAEAEIKRSQGVSESEVENFQLRQLEILRSAIKIMPLKSDFTTEISKSFESIFGKSIGSVPVFLRSDTNMEDLKDFTGAGLNLTIFNAAEKEKILQGIKDVWASPYTERSFKWRQKYLLNPENVFPSILVIPSVDVDYSGVLITKGISSGNEDDLTIAFSRGAGGAVDGQSAETYNIGMDGKAQLLSPARDAYHNTLPVTGGTGKKLETFEKPILNAQNILEISELSATIRKTMAKKTKSDYKGAYDVELGFKDNKLWLFQIRPFVENKSALGSDYLKSITPTINTQKEILLNTTL